MLAAGSLSSAGREQATEVWFRVNVNVALINPPPPPQNLFWSPGFGGVEKNEWVPIMRILGGLAVRVCCAWSRRVLLARGARKVFSAGKISDSWPAKYYCCHPIIIFTGPPYIDLFTHIGPKTSRNGK